MEKKKIKYSEGDLFIIDLGDRGKFLGLITRRQGRTKILAGYFWNLNFELNDDLILEKEEGILFTKFSGLGFEIGNWKIIGKYKKWEKDHWPIPKFRRYDELRKCYYSVSYNDELVQLSIQKITDGEAGKLFDDGLHGYISLENYLAKINISNSNKN